MEYIYCAFWYYNHVQRFEFSIKTEKFKKLHIRVMGVCLTVTL